MPANDKGVLITPGAVKDGAHLRARDVEYELRDVSVPPQVKSLLCRLAETNHFLMSRTVELATALDKTIDLVQQFADIAGNMKDRMDLLKKNMKEEQVDGDITTRD